jgi:hypothetical protein
MGILSIAMAEMFVMIGEDVRWSFPWTQGNSIKRDNLPISQESCKSHGPMKYV